MVFFLLVVWCLSLVLLLFCVGVSVFGSLFDVHRTRVRLCVVCYTLFVLSIGLVVDGLSLLI